MIKLSKNAIKFCLDFAEINIEDIDKVTFYEDPQLKFKRLLDTYFRFVPKTIPLFLELSFHGLKKDFC